MNGDRLLAQRPVAPTHDDQEPSEPETDRAGDRGELGIWSSARCQEHGETRRATSLGAKPSEPAPVPVRPCDQVGDERGARPATVAQRPPSPVPQRSTAMTDERRATAISPVPYVRDASPAKRIAAEIAPARGEGHGDDRQQVRRQPGCAARRSVRSSMPPGVRTGGRRWRRRARLCHQAPSSDGRGRNDRSRKNWATTVAMTKKPSAWPRPPVSWKLTHWIERRHRDHVPVREEEQVERLQPSVGRQV